MKIFLKVVSLYQSRSISQHLWCSFELRFPSFSGSSSSKHINKDKSSPTHPLLLIGWEWWLTDDVGKLQQTGHWTNTHWHQQCTSLNSKVWITSIMNESNAKSDVWPVKAWQTSRTAFSVGRTKLVDWREFWDIAWDTLGKEGNGVGWRRLVS